MHPSRSGRDREAAGGHAGAKHRCTGVWISSVQSLSHVRLFGTPWTAARQASLSITNSWSLLKLMSIESMMSSNDLVLCHSVLLHLQSFSASGSFPTSQFFKHQMAKPEKSRGQLLTAPERMKQLGQSRSDAQLWMPLEGKVKSEAVKKIITSESGMLGP